MDLQEQNRGLTQNDFVYAVGKWCRRIPPKLILCMIATFGIGLVAHMFFYTNTILFHDGAAFWAPPMSLKVAAGGARWFLAIANRLFDNMSLPWLEGIFVLFAYGLSAWMVCQVLGISRPLPVILVCGLLVTSPTTIASNFYLSSAHVYALALLFSCLAVYSYYYWKPGWLWSPLFMIMCCSTYAGYICVTISLYLLASIAKLLKNDPSSTPGKLWVDHIRMAALMLVSALVSYLIPVLMLDSTSSAVSRVNNVNLPLNELLASVWNQAMHTILYYTPASKVSFLQGESVLYAFFCAGGVVTVAALLFLFVYKKVWKKPLNLCLLVIDALLLPVGMDLVSAFYYGGHYLLQMALIMPWLIFIQLHEQMNLLDCYRTSLAKALRLIYSAAVILACVVTVLFGCRLANQAYTKGTNLAESGIHLANRVADRVESVEGYTPGETPVYFTGNFNKHYAPYQDAYEMLKSLTGVFYNTAFDYSYPFMTYMQQHLSLDIRFAATSFMEWMLDADSYAQILYDSDPSISREEFVQKYNATDFFPSRDCYFWLGDTLVFKLGE